MPQSTAIESLIGNADAFPVLRKWDFLNHAAVTPLPRVAGEALRAYAREAEDGAYVDTRWYKDVEGLRDSAAALINADRGEIALVKNTSEGIATVAGAIDWKAGDRIVTTAVEYPANVYPWMDLARRSGIELVTVPEHTDADGTKRVRVNELLAAADHPRTRLVTLSHAEFASGQRLDVATVGAFCRARGVPFLLDAIQTLGILPVDVQAMNVDYLAADGHKWLLGPEGAGIFYCRKELLPTTRPLMVGWMNVVHAGDYDNYDFTLKPTAARLECGTWNVPGFLALRAALDLLLAVGIDVVSARMRELTDRLATGLTARGFTVASPRGEGEWSGIVSFTPPSGDMESIVRRLRKDHRTEIALRGKRLRASPHFYNTEEQIDRFVEVVAGLS